MSDPEYTALARASRFASDPDVSSTQSEEIPLIPRQAKTKLIKFYVDRDAGSSNPQAPRDPRPCLETVAPAGP